ncbi:FAD-dependent oxidoreductase [Pandoraea apista]|uniref:oxidoreductase n=1 Tax=Pandoraea apista TaxID=93218 RepID=UPI00065910BE|nr:FAD-dependent oxidoreductase [Pandoraea apista]ALS65170.1 NADH:flavin oxidoreductase [Pandoraea apista]RRW92407.1 NADH:flavin oxidoreductase [Pandoraea apista]RRX01872.1 NADH:flavin oxidoreductase [Pandoraea apista]CFB65586.1 NADH oxidase [Pandoraea apista]
MKASPENTPYPSLFSPFRLGTLALRNRTVMAPMSTNMSHPDGSVSPRQVAFYQARAAGGIGLIIVEFCCVDAATGRSEHRQLTLETPHFLDGHQRLVEGIHRGGAAAALQLQHGGNGAVRSLLVDGIAVAPSDVPSRRDPTKRSARALTADEIEQLIERFGRTAELGVRAGYDAFELHGAHGYLLTSFLSPMTNHRDDAWGGDEARRLQFPSQVIARVKSAIGNRPLIYRLSADEFSPHGLNIDDMVRIAPALVRAGADALHVSIGTGWTGLDKVIEPMSVPEGWRLPYARRIRAAVDVPVIGVGQIRWPETAEGAIVRGDADLVALGRPLLADPEWPNKAKRGEIEAIRPCTSCNYCVSMHAGEHGGIGCAENPRTGHELDALPDAGALRGARAVVIGGGPGGMSAALMLDAAGFRTELFEARQQLGGGLIASAAPPDKEKLGWYQQYLEQCLASADIKVHLGHRVRSEDLLSAPPAIVVVAGGGTPKPMSIDGISLPNVHDAYALLMGDASALPAPGQHPVMVYGGGETGCETAEYLAARHYRVVLVSRSAAKQLARSAEMIYRQVLLARLQANPAIEIVDEYEIRRIAPDGTVTLVSPSGQSKEVQTDAVLIAQGRTPDTSLTEALLEAGIPVVTIGDARRGGRIGDAVNQAYSAVVALCATGAPPRELRC